MPNPTPVLPPSQGYPTGTYPTAGTWGYPLTPAAPASSGRPVPATSGISPTSMKVNTGAFDLVVKGANFTAESVIKLNGVAQPTIIIDASTLVTSQTSQGKTAGGVPVTVDTGGAVSSPAVTFTYTP